MAKQQMFVSSAKRPNGNGDGTLNLEIALSPPPFDCISTDGDNTPIRHGVNTPLNYFDLVP